MRLSIEKMRRLTRLAVPLSMFLALGCTKVRSDAEMATQELGSGGMEPPRPPGGGADAGTSTDPSQGPLPDPCPDGQVIVCDEGGCNCGVPPDDPATCDAQNDCTGDEGCGDGQCCHNGSCIAKTGDCACGDAMITMGSSAAPGCPDSGGFEDMVKEQAQYICQSQAPMFGNRCTSLGQCIGTADIDDVNLQCFDFGNLPSESGMMVAVCYHCVDTDPPDVPPNNSGQCDDLQVQIANKKAEINAKNLEIKYLADGIAKLEAAIATWQSMIDGLQDAESKVIAGTFGDNIFMKTSGQSIKFVTDIYGGAKAVSAVSKVGCLGQRAYCGTSLFGKVPQYSWKNVLISKKAWGEVYEPAVLFGLSKAAGDKAAPVCPADPPDDGWFSWWPGLSSGNWFFGCFTKAQVIEQIGENRINAINTKNQLTSKRDAMKAQRDQALKDVGAMQAALDALQKQFDDLCTCNHP